MRLSVKLMISGAVFMVVSVVCLLGVWGRIAALGELSEYLGMTDDFQHRLVELSWCRDRMEMDRQLTELQHVFETMNGRPKLLKEIGGRYGGQGKVIQGELAVLKATGLGVNRLQDAEKIRELSDQMGELAGLAVARMLVNRSAAWRYAVIWIVIGILLLAANGVFYWLDIHNRLKQLSLQLVSRDDEKVVYQPLHDISEIGPALQRYSESIGQRVQGHEFFGRIWIIHFFSQGFSFLIYPMKSCP